MTETELTELRAEFVKRLRGHDWSYRYADDYGEYRKGSDNESWLTWARKQLPDGVEVWNAYAPVGQKIEPVS